MPDVERVLLQPCGHALPPTAAADDILRLFWTPGTMPACPVCQMPICGVEIRLYSPVLGVR